jgi:hypothetical protein
MTKFGDAPIKREGDIVDPDECTWECDCEKCQARYQKWKAAYNDKGKGEHMTGFKSKQAAAQAKLTDDDDIQDYKKLWVGLTEDEAIELLPVGDWEIESTLEFAKAIEAKLKEKNI